jgi:hypothetical protein
LHLPFVFVKLVAGSRFGLVDDGSKVRQDALTLLRKRGKLP